MRTVTATGVIRADHTLSISLPPDLAVAGLPVLGTAAGGPGLAVGQPEEARLRWSSRCYQGHQPLSPQALPGLHAKSCHADDIERVAEVKVGRNATWLGYQKYAQNT